MNRAKESARHLTHLTEIEKYLSQNVDEECEMESCFLNFPVGHDLKKDFLICSKMCDLFG